jgi:hypothetical protein
MHKQHPSFQRHEGSGFEAENERPAMEEDAPSPTIHNIVSTSKIVCIASSLPQHHASVPDATNSATPVAINLDHIYEVVQCSHYNRRKFAAITIRIDDPTVTALLFTSGRLVITGSKSWYECMLASLVVVKMLRQVQPECHFYVQVSFTDCQDGIGLRADYHLTPNQDCEIQNVQVSLCGGDFLVGLCAEYHPPRIARSKTFR